MEWLVPWYSVADNLAHAAGLERELSRELSAGHPLFGLSVRALGRRQDRDDVLFAVADGTERAAVVHLTWTSRAEQWPWPEAVVYASLSAWAAEGMRADHDEFHDEAPEEESKPNK